MGVIEEIKQLATQIGTDVKALRNEKVNKSDIEQLKQKVIQIQDNVHQGQAPECTFSIDDSGDLWVDITYRENTTLQTPPVNIGEVRVFNVIWGVAVAGAPGDGRGYLEWNPSTGVGKLHLDIRMTRDSGEGEIICTLPNNAPVPIKLLETAVDANNNSIYVEPNSHAIKGWGVQGNNRRYLFDILGFWRLT